MSSACSNRHVFKCHIDQAGRNPGHNSTVNPASFPMVSNTTSRHGTSSYDRSAREGLDFRRQRRPPLFFGSAGGSAASSAALFFSAIIPTACATLVATGLEGSDHLAPLEFYIRALQIDLFSAAPGPLSHAFRCPSNRIEFIFIL